MHCNQREGLITMKLKITGPREPMSEFDYLEAENCGSTGTYEWGLITVKEENTDSYS